MMKLLKWAGVSAVAMLAATAAHAGTISYTDITPGAHTVRSVSSPAVTAASPGSA